MRLEERLEHALDDRDMISVKSHLTSFIDKYPRNEDNAVVEAFERARSRCPELVQPHDGTILLPNMSAWNEDYLALLMDDLIDNFSTERFLHTLEVSEHLHQQKYAPEEQKQEKDELALELLPRRRTDVTVWIILVVAAILFLVLVTMIRSAL